MWCAFVLCEHIELGRHIRINVVLVLAFILLHYSIMYVCMYVCMYVWLLFILFLLWIQVGIGIHCEEIHL